MATQQTRHRDEEVKEAFSETIQHGKEALASLKEDSGDKLLTVALGIHALINLVQSGMLLFRPGRIAPGMVSLETKLHGPEWVLLRCFAFMTLGMALIAGGAALKYDTKHKFILNNVLLALHTVILGDMVMNNWYSGSTGFRMSPGFFHIPMMALHGLALLAYQKPEQLTGGRHGTGKSKAT